MSTRVKSSIIPPNGWHFPQQRADGTQIIIESSDYESLKLAVLHYRLDNNIEPGDFEAEVESYICRLAKGQCHPVGQSGPVQSAPRIRGLTLLINRIKPWLAAMLDNQARRLVNPVEATRRSEICMCCTQNVQWHTSCHPCNDDLERKLFMLRQGKDVRTAAPLYGCRALGHCNRTAPWFDLDSLPKENLQSAPRSCWLHPD